MTTRRVRLLKSRSPFGPLLAIGSEVELPEDVAARYVARRDAAYLEDVDQVAAQPEPQTDHADDAAILAGSPFDEPKRPRSKRRPGRFGSAAD